MESLGLQLEYEWQPVYEWQVIKRVTGTRYRLYSSIRGLDTRF